MCPHPPHTPLQPTIHPLYGSTGVPLFGAAGFPGCGVALCRPWGSVGTGPWSVGHKPESLKTRHCIFVRWSWGVRTRTLKDSEVVRFFCEGSPHRKGATFCLKNAIFRRGLRPRTPLSEVKLSFFFQNGADFTKCGTANAPLSKTA